MIGTAFLFLLSFQACSKEIVFILGADAPNEPAYYQAATEYYRDRNRATPLFLVTTARSLSEVREVLQRTDNKGAWTEITLVAHGSSWRGMQVNVYPDGTPATLENIENVVASGAFSGLPETKINSGTLIRLESCSIGRRPDYLDAIARLFAADKTSLPRIESSRDFIAYVVSNEQDAGKITRRIELPVVIKTLSGSLKKIGSKSIAAEVNKAREILDVEMPGSGKDAVWTVAPINMEMKVMLPRANKSSALRIARENEFVRNAVRIHGLQIDDMAWELASDYDSDGKRDLKGHAIFILMHASLRFAASVHSPGTDAIAR